MSHTQTICKKPKWTGQTTVGRAFANRLSSIYNRDDIKNDDCRLIINISGLYFETLLGDNQHRLCFEAILYYYQSQGCLRRRENTTLEYPQYSTAAKIVNIISLFLILLSAVDLAVETLPMYRRATNH